MTKGFNRYYCFVTIFFCMRNLNNVYAKDSMPVHLNYRGKYTSDIKDYEIVVPQRVNKDGSFISHFVSHHHSKRSTEELDYIFYKIPIAGKDYLIELTPNRKLISPGAVVEIHKDIGKLKKRGFTNENSTNDQIENMFENLNIRKLKDTECHFSGHVKGENISKAALSTCYGLAGFIQIKKGFYTIEPVAEHDPSLEEAYPHLLYKTDGLEISAFCKTLGEITPSLTDQVVRKRRESNGGTATPMYIETLLVMDKTLIKHHRDTDCENYVLTVFNMASNIFHDASLGLMMTPTIVRIIRLEVEDDEMNLKVNSDAKKTLQYFQSWQYDINPGDDSHPNHHDVAVLITRVDVCYTPSSCGLLGLTTIGKACDPKLSSALCEDNGLRLGFVIAHEIGHLLGANHDSNTTCNGTDSEGLKTVMHPHVSLTTQTWSKCSQAYLRAFVENGMGHCLLDEPEEHHFNSQDLLPGVMYNADFQCKHLITSNARECEMGSTCDSLNCHIPGYACIVTHSPPADGTRCGENMWCHDAKCLVVGERPGAVDGNWGEWSPWSECSRTCGSGVASSVRNCDKPVPSHGGKNCMGERKRYKVCAATITTVPQNISDLIRFISEEVNVSFVGKPCESGRPSFRDIQCGEFDDWVYPEDGKIHTWRAHYFHDDNPCTLYCISEKKQVAALRPRVVDGTMCYKGIRDICIGGICKSLPCDLHFESNAVEDACGVCHGDGTGCEFSEGMETLPKLTKGLTKLVNVPSGTRNIKVEEMSPTSARIIVRDKDSKDIYVRGKSLGMFNVPGSQAWLGMVKKNQEALNIPGPISKPLSIWIQRLENVTIKWSMALPAEQQRKPEFTWDYLKWGPCSTKCGPGTQKSEPSCIEEKAGLVEDTFCADLEVPPVKVRPCEIAKCEPRWMVGDWKGCESPGSKKKERKRVVYCIKTVGEGEGESKIVADSECQEPKPHTKEYCENRQKRENNEFDIDDNFFEEDSMLQADSSEFGFHKKYDDYLTHFAALSGPQRKSETIPLHLVSSPHFKHYFRVLLTPEDYPSDSDTAESSISLSNATMSDSEAKNKVSPDFYKDTFSGKQIDVSQFQTGMGKEPKSLPPEYVSSLNSSSVLKLSKRNKSRLRRKNFENHRGPQKHNCRRSSSTESHAKKCKLHKRFINKLGLEYPDPIIKRYDKMRPLKSSRKANIKGRKVISTEGTPDSTPSTDQCCPTQFNESLANFTHVIENINEMNEQLKNRYMELMKGQQNTTKIPYQNGGEARGRKQSRGRRYEWQHHNPKPFSGKFPSYFKPFSRFPPAKNTPSYKDRFHNFKKMENSMYTQDANQRRINPQEFDGSGIRKVNIVPPVYSKPAPREEYPIKSDNEELVPHERKNYFSNPFDPMRTGTHEMRSRGPNFRDRRITLEDLYTEKKNKRYRPGGPGIENGYLAVQNSLGKRKRSSHKWKKPKIKEPNQKSNKDVSGNGGGTETRKYLNNLFRDTYPKIFNKQEPPKESPKEKPVIKAGQLVIDKDSTDDQRVEILFQDDDVEANNQKFKLLPKPSGRDSRMALQGKAVFDLYQILQQRGERAAFIRPYEITEKSMEVDEDNSTSPVTTEVPEETEESVVTETELTANPETTEAQTTEPITEEETTQGSTIQEEEPESIATSSVSFEPHSNPERTSTELGMYETTRSTGEVTETKSHICCTDEVEETITNNCCTTTEPTRRPKKPKCKKKKKKKKHKTCKPLHTFKEDYNDDYENEENFHESSPQVEDSWKRIRERHEYEERGY